MLNVLKLAPPTGSKLLNAQTLPRFGQTILSRVLLYCLLAVLGASGPLADAVAQEAFFSEEEVKAAFLYHFGSYVQWPTTSTEPVTIGVLGDDGVAARLDLFLRNRTIQNRPVEARRLSTANDIEGVEILYIGREHDGELEQLLAAVGDSPVLTVTDSDRGLDSGAIVNFQVIDERVRFEISVPASERAGLMLSSRLLSAAMRVRTSWCASLGCQDGLWRRTLNVLLRALRRSDEAPT